MQASMRWLLSRGWYKYLGKWAYMCGSKHVRFAHAVHMAMDGWRDASSRVGGGVNDGRNAGTVVDAAGVTRPCPPASTPVDAQG